MSCKYGSGSKMWILLGSVFIWVLVLSIPFANAQLEMSIGNVAAFPLQTGLEVPINLANLAYLDTLGVGVGIAVIRIDIKYDDTILKATGSTAGEMVSQLVTDGDWTLADTPDLAPNVIRIMLNDDNPPDNALTSATPAGTFVNAVFDVITADPTRISNLNFDLIDVAAFDQDLTQIQVDTTGTSGTIVIDALKLSISTPLCSPPWSGNLEDPYPEVKVPINIGNLAYLGALDILGVASIRVAIKYNDAVLKAKEGAEKGPVLPNPDNWKITDNPDWEPDATLIFIYDNFPPDNVITDSSEEGTIMYAVFEVISTDKTDTSFLDFDLSEAKALDENLDEVDIITETINGDLCLPVELSASGALWSMGEGIKIFWEAVSQQGNLGWNIYRSKTKDGKFAKINGELVAGAGTTSNPTKYSFVDEEVEKGKVYYYYLEDISFNGEKHRTPLIRTSLVNNITSWGDIKRSALD